MIEGIRRAGYHDGPCRIERECGNAVRTTPAKEGAADKVACGIESDDESVLPASEIALRSSRDGKVRAAGLPRDIRGAIARQGKRGAGISARASEPRDTQELRPARVKLCEQHVGIATGTAAGERRARYL